MPTDFSKFSSLLFVAVLLWVLYRRVRRSFGRQPLSAKRMGFRVVFLGVLGVLFSPLALKSLPLAAGVLCGLGAGILLALWGASQTRIGRDVSGPFYVPHTYSGLAVTALFLGRLAYRYLQASDRGMPHTQPQDFGQLSAMYGRSPLTLGFFFVVVGYYVCFYGIVMYKARHLRDAAGGLAGTPVTGDSSKPA